MDRIFGAEAADFDEKVGEPHTSRGQANGAAPGLFGDEAVHRHAAHEGAGGG